MNSQIITKFLQELLKKSKFYWLSSKWPSPLGTFHILIGKFLYYVIIFLLNSSVVKSDLAIGLFWNSKKSDYTWTRSIPLLICTNQVRQTGSKNPVQNRLKSSSSNLIFPNWFFLNQVQISRGNVLHKMYDSLSIGIKSPNTNYGNLKIP